MCLECYMNKVEMYSSILKAFGGLLYLVIWADAAQSSALYQVETLTCDINYGHVIATTNAKSAIHCSSDCESWTGCRSSVMDISTGTCYLNKKTKKSGDVVEGECGKELKYARIEKLTVSRQCKRKQDCNEKNLPFCENNIKYCVLCIEGKCSCKRRHYYYNIIDHTCRSNCMNYDDTFDYFGHLDFDWSDKSMHSNVSLEECKEACLSETSFSATWYSYQAESALCTYTDGFDNGQVYRHNESVAIYRRLCADP